MAGLPENFVRAILFAGRAGPRLLSENAVQFSVWASFAANLQEPLDLLLSPFDATPAGKVALALHQALHSKPATKRRLITPVEGAVAARLDFDDFLAVVLPSTGLDLRASLDELRRLVEQDRAYEPGQSPSAVRPVLSVRDLLDFEAKRRGELSPDLRAALLVALILAVRRMPGTWLVGGAPDFKPLLPDLASTPAGIEEAGAAAGPQAEPPLIWRVSVNRRIERLGISTETIKADAAQRVFDLDCRTLTWAVIDSGIDGSHPAFHDHAAGNFAIRIDKAYDFARLRELAAYDTLLDPKELAKVLVEVANKLAIGIAEARAWLEQLRSDAEAGRPYDWEALEKLLEVRPDRLEAIDDGRPVGHGTHVAGVLAGDWREGERVIYRGVCPTLRLYDLRILGAGSEETEFAVIGALAFVRWVNGRNRYITIHGVNLSIGLVYDMANHACGRTPVCLACEATVASGVTVVAAAGNWGAQTFLTESGSYAGFSSTSIADPGNAESVITVGATHRERPHEYGVSFFSSRGPTGDGRAKPDVVAPGERIDGPLPNLGFGRLDGTSMAAPHVSGVAALLMARYPEMIGDPRRVKNVIVRSATDLGRERHFQGAGLVDALRALQAV